MRIEKCCSIKKDEYLGRKGECSDQLWIILVRKVKTIIRKVKRITDKVSNKE